MENIIGPPVIGKNFQGRSAEMNEIWKIVNKSSILLNGPRRYGKTSITKEMERRPKKGWRVFYFDLESINSPVDFILTITGRIGGSEKLRNKILQSLNIIRESLEEIQVAEFKIKLRESIAKDWQHNGTKIFERLNESGKLILILDEFPIMISNFEQREGTDLVKGFLQWLRQIRNSYGVRFIICGSVSMRQIIRRCKASAYTNDLRLFNVDVFSRSIAYDITKKLFKAYGIQCNDWHAEEIYNKMGIAVPYILQLLIQNIVHEMRENSVPLNETTINNAYEHRLLGTQGKFYFDYYFNKLDAHYEKEHLVVRRILNYICTHDNCSFEKIFNIYAVHMKKGDKQRFSDLMERLEDDFYIVRSNNGTFKFHNKVLQDVWSRKIGN